jgi:hypothetical protein
MASGTRPSMNASQVRATHYQSQPDDARFRVDSTPATIRNDDRDRIIWLQKFSGKMLSDGTEGEA